VIGLLKKSDQCSHVIHYLENVLFSCSIERLHSFPRDQLNKSHCGHFGVPDKRVTNMAAVTSCANGLLGFIVLIIQSQNLFV
jgi:hypothetical protein